MDNAPGTNRRRLLKRGAVLFGGIATLGLAGRAVTEGGGGGDTRPGALTMTVHGTDWRMTYPERRRGVLPVQGERSASFGQLVMAPGGDKIGEFYASSFQFGAPFGHSDVAAQAMEMHHFNFADGTIVGMGTPGANGTSVHAIIGGTGRYEGASGSYTARQEPLDLGGDGSAEFNFRIILGRA